jgi:hypothetical protein
MELSPYFLTRQFKISFLLYLLLLLKIPVHAGSFDTASLQSGFDSIDNLLTIAPLPPAIVDSVLTTVGHISDQDATKTNKPLSDPFPPEPPSNGKVCLISRANTRIDTRKLTISSKNDFAIINPLSNIITHPPNNSISFLSSPVLRHEVLRI